jgi:stringent starvation protein B
MAETSTKPYMIRALYEWCCDNGYTPYLAVAVDEHTIVPRQHVKAGEIVLNVSPMATSRLTLGNELVEFQARFSGVAQQISIPIGNISAIYARETGHGMAFDVPRPPAVPEDEPGANDLHGGGTVLGHVPVADDQGGDRSPASSVQSLRGGVRRRGPRSVDSGDRTPGEPASGRQRITGPERDPAGVTGEDPSDDLAANSRKRASRGQGSADVIEFAPSGGTRKKKTGASRTKSEETTDGSRSGDAKPGEDNDDPPPSDGGSPAGKGSKAKLTRVK